MKVTKYSDEIMSITKVLDFDICNDCIFAAEEDGLFPKLLQKIPSDITQSFENRVFLTSKELADIIWDRIKVFNFARVQTTSRY
jgi:hypothetical protein